MSGNGTEEDSTVCAVEVSARDGSDKEGIMLVLQVSAAGRLN